LKPFAACCSKLLPAQQLDESGSYAWFTKLNLKGAKMLSTYKEKILKEIDQVPEDKMPTLYRVIHLLATELMTGRTGNRGSLKGIWKDSQIDESLLMEAKKSLFPYEYR
jgi:hypothetical protein